MGHSVTSFSWQPCVARDSSGTSRPRATPDRPPLMSTQWPTDAKQALSNRTSVDLDEEAARLVQFQQGYQAAAKALRVAS